MKKSACRELTAYMVKIARGGLTYAQRRAKGLPAPPKGYDPVTLKEQKGPQAEIDRQSFKKQEYPKQTWSEWASGDTPKSGIGKRTSGVNSVIADTLKETS